MKSRNITILLILFLAHFGVLQSQCLPDRHNTSWHDGWISCEMDINPNKDHGLSHWILYNFGQVHRLGNIKIWNSNHPNHIDYGLQTIAIDYSIDGNQWTQLGVYDVDMAPGRGTYEGQDLSSFEGEEAQYVLITALDNYGGDCYGISEVRFETEDRIQTTSIEQVNLDYCMSAEVFPNPFVDDPTLSIKSNCGSSLQVTMRDAIGRSINNFQLLPNSQMNQTLNTESLATGVYFLDVAYEGITKQFKLIKM